MRHKILFGCAVGLSALGIYAYYIYRLKQLMEERKNEEELERLVKGIRICRK